MIADVRREIMMIRKNQRSGSNWIGHRYFLWIAMTLVVVMCAGCGTVSTRLGDHTFGGYPYEAVAIDVRLVPASFEQPGHPTVEGFNCATAIVAIPFDLVFDTLFLLPDLIYWADGEHKEGFHFGP